ncbi:class I SAM-dependent methyltransferase [Hellea balneolensis]|uniref:class I SAM-dependent methyltransferase n=1 Tax=Hellea balneolensis TaxID=287478 RepID=UPI0004263494|nr:SAM-dependent methyltransferase [Hellea balneolensis]
MTSPLKDRLIAKIKAEGPLTVAEYMTICLLDPVHGYYPTRDPLGSDGDFITAPEISQMFGEVIGLWCLQTWQDMGRPHIVQLIELGPGRGIMMSDILRAAKLDKDFLAALSVTLIEASPALEAVQGKTLKSAPCQIGWVASLEKAPKGPSIIIGNEFLDCLPIRQFVQKDRFAGRAGWQERMITLDEEALRFGISPAPISENLKTCLPNAQEDAKNDNLLEVCPATAQIIDQIEQRFKIDSGRALFIDYGPETTEFGDTLQALKRHKKVGVFSDPGNTDLTARVDFGALIENAKAIDLAVTRAVAQREFLSKLGLEMRAVALSRAKPESKEKIARQLHRLTASDEMGELFKAICFQSEGLGLPLGFRDFA